MPILHPHCYIHWCLLRGERAAPRLSGVHGAKWVRRLKIPFIPVLFLSKVPKIHVRTSRVKRAGVRALILVAEIVMKIRFETCG